MKSLHLLLLLAISASAAEFSTIKPGETLRAPLTDQQQVRLAMQKSGFTNVRQEVFAEGHAVKRAHLRAALRWFRGSGLSP